MRKAGRHKGTGITERTDTAVPGKRLGKKLFPRAGVFSFSCREVDWKQVCRDVEVLIKRLHTS